MVESAGQNGDSLKGKVLYIPRMSDEGARLMASAFCSRGIDGRVSPKSDARTREASARYLTGEECYPTQITLGNFLKVIEADDFDPKNTCFFLPGAEGPCRFGQYAPLFRKIFDDIGHGDVQIISPSSRFGYGGLKELDSDFERTGWRALVASDILRKMRLMIRPYEVEAGATDACMEKVLVDCGEALAEPDIGHKQRLAKLIDALVRSRDRLRAIPRKVETRPLIGIVGEIFCRLNEFSNGNIIRRIEALGGEAWLSDITEWIHYTKLSREDHLREEGKIGGKDFIKMKLGAHIQGKDESALLEPFEEDFAGREEPHHMKSFVELSEPYLPFRGSLGEMTLSVAKAIYIQKKGADGVLDISPFTCMNGIVSEAVYPRVSRDFEDIPIRNLYFDGTGANLDRDLGMFLDLARSYRRRRGTLAAGA